MIEIKDIDGKPVLTQVLDETATDIVNNTCPPVITISGDMSVVDIFNMITSSGILTSKDMYELGSYLRTFADFHTPVEQEPADRPIPYRGF